MLVELRTPRYVGGISSLLGIVPAFGGGGLMAGLSGTVGWVWSTVIGLLLQDGKADLWSSIRITVAIFCPLWVGLGFAQWIGFDIPRVVCQSQWFGVGIPGLVGTVVQITIGLFALKFLLRAMRELAGAASGSPEFRAAGFSLCAAVVPVLAAELFRSGGPTLASCLL